MKRDSVNGAVALRVREATPDDAAVAARIWSAANPDEPHDEPKKRYLWAKHEPEIVRERLLVLADNAEVIGWLGMKHQRWDRVTERLAKLRVQFLPERRTQTNFGAAYDLVEARAIAAGATGFRSGVSERDPWKLEMMPKLGYRRIGVEEVRDLDLVANRQQLLAALEQSRERMRREGVTITTLAKIDWPDKYRALHDVFVEAKPPGADEDPPMSFESYLQYHHSPMVHEDRVWVAVLDGRLVGETELTWPVEYGEVWTAWTGVAPAARNRGIARALKLECFAQAIELGTQRVRTSNDERNAPMLHINDTLGYQKGPGWIQFRKDA